jgi:hypothetical protein
VDEALKALDGRFNEIYGQIHPTGTAAAGAAARDAIPGTGSGGMDVHLRGCGLQPGSDAKPDGADCLRAAGEAAECRRGGGVNPMTALVGRLQSSETRQTLAANLQIGAFQQPARG